MFDTSVSTPSGWTFPLPFEEDETLSSWLCRSAHLHGAMPYGFMSARFPGVPVWDRDVDLWAPSALCAAIDAAAGLCGGVASAATLKPCVATLCRSVREGAKAHVPFILTAGVFHRSRRRHGLQFCPECLKEGVPCFRRWGRLAFAVVCPRHGTPALDACPSCDAPVMPHRAPVRALRACHACGADLARRHPEADVTVEMDVVSRLQDLCLAALAAPDATTVVPGVTGGDLLAMVRCLTAVVASSVDGGTGDGRRQLEMMRVAGRARLLARVARLLEEWPSGFRSGAPDLSLTRRTFARRDVPPALAAEIACLDAGVRRRRAAWRSAIAGADMRRLRRADRAAYRKTRAARLLATIPV